jgi:hypothetical protein
MSKKMKSIEVSEHADAVMQALQQVVKHIKDALADGWQTGQDLPVILSQSFDDLIVVIGNVKEIPVEAKEDVVAFGKAITDGGWDMAALFIKKVDAAAEEANKAEVPAQS